MAIRDSARFLLMFLCLLILASCNTYKKQVPTGRARPLTNVYTNPFFEHGKLLNVLVLPISNPLSQETVEAQEKELLFSVLRNFGKFSYFNLQPTRDEKIEPAEVINLETGEVDRFKLGALGDEYHAQAVLQVSIQEYRSFIPLRMKVKAALVDVETGDRIWAIDEVFDTQDADIVNSMRVWWNSRIAGGDKNQHFGLTQVSPGFFMNFVFYEVARSYADMRIKNVRAIAEQKEIDQKQEQKMKKLQKKIKKQVS